MGQVEIKSADEIARMREAGRIVCEILDELERAVAPGVSTWDLDALAEKLIHAKGAKPAFKGYHGDSARTVPVGKVSAQARSLIDATREALARAIEAMVPGNRLGDIGH